MMAPLQPPANFDNEQFGQAVQPETNLASQEEAPQAGNSTPIAGGEGSADDRFGNVRGLFLHTVRLW